MQNNESSPELQIQPVHATPFAVLRLPNSAVANERLAEFFRTTAAGDPAGWRTPHYYGSVDDLLKWRDEPLQTVLQDLVQGVCRTVRELVSLGQEQWDDLSLQARGGFTLVLKDGCVPTTSHPMTSWCALYCVAAPAESASRYDSGRIRLHETRLSTMFPDATSAALQGPYAHGHAAWRPLPGHLAIFPGAVPHEVALVRGTGDLILVTLRVRFVGRQQTGYARW